MNGVDAARLELSPERMRAFGHGVVDAIIAHMTNLETASATPRATRAAMDATLWTPPPRGPTDANAVLAQTVRDVFGHCMDPGHPRYFAFVPGPNNYVGAMADALASGFNAFCGTWLESAGAAEVELVTLDWLRQGMGLPDGFGGLFVSGGSVANLTALAASRTVMLDDRIEGAVAYGSDLTHRALDKAFRILGFRSEQFRRLPCDDEGRLPVDTLGHAIATDRAAGLRPFCVVANAGTTNTGAVDPLPEIARLCRSENLWLHVDGAYGAAAALTRHGRARLAGIGDAHSLVIDPHKWLFQPYEAGVVLVRDMAWLRRAFAIDADYMQDTAPSTGEINFCDHGIQLTRGFRALKLWMTIKVFGLDALTAAVQRGIDLAETAGRLIAAHPRFEVVTPPSLGVVTFRYRPAAALDEGEIDSLNRRIVAAMLDDGFALVTSTLIRGRTVLRLCTINPRTTEGDLAATLARLADLGDRGRAG
ncbi:MAG: decarboxylase [Alphaproteobacteria bacterium]|nr:decarboxylase [Alphaproteobacteria bacterium]